jgi:hypothetical protein
MIKEITEKCLDIGVYEKREAGEAYSEFVVANDKLDAFKEVLNTFLGDPVKEPQVKPSKEDLKITNEFGGICKDQTLFKKDSEDSTVIAMFWPWQNNMQTTVKIIQIKK